jgi:hypothetical protein
MHAKTRIFSGKVRQPYQTFFEKFDNLAGFFPESPITSPDIFQKVRQPYRFFSGKFDNFTRHFLKSPVTLPDFSGNIQQ